MKKLIQRKLVLRRETLRTLERVELIQVAGGDTTDTGDVNCPTGRPNAVRSPGNA
ncbi:MAG TPA: hypothetical protein VH165_33270 [Kofleriaceae bacterium]|jgi:hypothetical protein|nr:hypothetical protein [Kofleriaceae bacterium]